MRARAGGLLRRRSASEPQIVDRPRAGLPEDQVRVGARRAANAHVDGLPAPELDRVDVALVVPEVERRLDALDRAPELAVRCRAGVVVRLEPVARRQLVAAERAERLGHVQPAPAAQPVAPERAARGSRTRR